MHACLCKLLKDRDEESLECLCQLLITIGKDIDHEKAKVVDNSLSHVFLRTSNFDEAKSYVLNFFGLQA